MGRKVVVQTTDSKTQGGQEAALRRSRRILQTVEAGPIGRPRWRISPEPFWLDADTVRGLESLGHRLLKFYDVLNRLYLESGRGPVPEWFGRYLDQGKPSDLVAFGRMKRAKTLLPGIIRPDLILTEGGMVCTELDAVPGGFGMTACLAGIYSDEGFEVVGGGSGIVRGFADMIRNVSEDADPDLAVVVSEESEDYRLEMAWLAEALRKGGLRAQAVRPEDLVFSEGGILLGPGGQMGANEQGRPLKTLYRFFELFDLKNIPKSELFLYAAKKQWVHLTPPVKAHLEEKLAFALYHHPVLAPLWIERLGEHTYRLLADLFPRSWILDPAKVPPYAVIPELKVSGRAVSNWEALEPLTQKERRFVIKPSGFSDRAWGSRGVIVGHDVSEADWGNALRDALAAYPSTPHILQEFRKGRRVTATYFDEDTGTLREMPGRARLCPYYFVIGDRVELGGILATVCPLDKKLIHGMKDAVMMPCAVRSS